MCSLVFLCWAWSLRRLWLVENWLCLLQHTSKSASLCIGKVLREPAHWLPIMHCCFLDRTIFRKIQSASSIHSTKALALLFFQNGLEMTWNCIFCSFFEAVPQLSRTLQQDEIIVYDFFIKTYISNKNLADMSVDTVLDNTFQFTTCEKKGQTDFF